MKVYVTQQDQPCSPDTKHYEALPRYNDAPPCFDEKRQVGTCVQPALIMVIVVFAVSALCVDVSKGGVLFNELAAWGHILAHEH